MPLDDSALDSDAATEPPVARRTDAATETLVEELTLGPKRANHSTYEPIRGDVIGRYVVLERLGAGAMGVVFAAYDPELDRRVALKLLHARSRGPAQQSQLWREAQSLAKVTHPCVVAVHDVGVHEEQVFLAMEYIAGETLRAHRARTNSTLAERIELLTRAGEGLMAAHTAGLVHRDFKPDNVMIASDGRVKVMDFGLARASEGMDSRSEPALLPDADLRSSRAKLAQSQDETHAGALVGTPAYMAPEQHAGLAADARSDQFAFAVTAYEMLYGVRPFSGSSLSALSLAITEGKVDEPPRQHNVPSWMRKVLLRGLAVDPSQRWPDVAAMLEALTKDPYQHRSRSMWLGLGLGAAAVAGAVLTYALSGGAPPPVDLCAQVNVSMDAAWSEEKRAKLREALELGRDADGAVLAQSVISTLDAYAQGWSQAHLGNCRDTFGSRTQSERVHALRESCFRHRQISLEQLVATLTQDPASQARALEAATSLPPIDGCSDVRSIELEPALPTDPSKRERVENARDELAALQALVDATPGPVIVKRVAEFSHRADELEYGPLIAEAHLIYGLALNDTDDLEGGVEHLRRSYFTALKSASWRVQVRAASELVFTIGYLQQDHKLGKEWADHAMAVLDHIGDDGLLKADTYHAYGVLLDASGDDLGAQRAYQTAYEIRDRLLPDPHPDRARSLNSLGNCAHGLGDHESAIRYHRAALAMREKLYGPRHRSSGTSWNNLSLSLRDSGDLAGAREALLKSTEIEERNSGSLNDGLARSVTNLAEVERRLGNYSAAIEQGERALKIRIASVGIDHPEVADTLVVLALAHRDRGDFKRARELAEDALARLQRDFAPDHPLVFNAQVTLALIQESQGETKEASGRVVAALAAARDDHIDPADRTDATQLLARLGTQK